MLELIVLTQRERTGKELVKRLLIALTAYVALAGLTWTTIEDERIRAMTFALLALFALKTWLRRKDVMDSRGGSEIESEIR